MHKVIAVTGDKGGVGKSTITCLIAEWFLFKGKSIKVIDADPNRTTQIWLDKCSSKGYKIYSDNPDIIIVDTAGASGASGIKYVRSANLIVAPFQAHVADLETVINWFLTLNFNLQKKVCFLPNRKENTKEQREGITQIEQILKEEKVGVILPGLTNRPAVYPTLLNGLEKSYFLMLRDKKVIAEIKTLMEAIDNLLLKNGEVV